MLLIALGILLLANKAFDLRLFALAHLWPLFILLPGLIMEIGYFTGRFSPGLLVPGGILTTLGVLFFFETVTGWRFAAYTWPVYPLAVAIGLWQLYYFSERKQELLIPVYVLGGISLASFGLMIIAKFLSWISFSWAVPVLLILLGVFLLLRNKVTGN